MNVTPYYSCSHPHHHSHSNPYSPDEKEKENVGPIFWKLCFFCISIFLIKKQIDASTMLSVFFKQFCTDIRLKHTSPKKTSYDKILRSIDNVTMSNVDSFMSTKMKFSFSECEEKQRATNVFKSFC